MRWVSPFDRREHRGYRLVARQECAGSFSGGLTVQLEIVSSSVGVLMTTITDAIQTGFTGIIEIEGIWVIVEDGQVYYFDDTDKED